MKYPKAFLVGILVLAAGTSEAQISRVFVSTNGNDANDCMQPVTACRTLAGGIGKVDAHGEVIVVDTGSYAGTTITKSVKIDAAPGVVAFSALGIVLNLPSDSDVVVLRGLTLKSLSPLWGYGVTLSKGNLFLENCVIDGWEVGVLITAPNSKVFVKNTSIRNNAAAGLMVNSTTASVAVEGSFFEKNIFGVWAAAGQVALTRSVISGNTVGLLSGFGSSGAGQGKLITAQFCQITSNGEGVRTQFGGVARISDSTIAGNSLVGLNNLVSDGGTMERFGTNLMSGNGANFAGTITVGALQ